VTSDSTLGKLPAYWKEIPLGELLTCAQYGLSVRGNGQGAYPILRMTNQVSGRIVARDLQFADIGRTDLEKFRVMTGDLLFNRTNSFDLVGRTAIFELEGDFVFASYLIRLRTTSDRLNPHFLNFYLNGDETQRRLKSIASRAVSQSNISASRLKGFVIPVPPLPEQRQIATVLSAVQRAIERQERLIALTAELKKALMHKLFTEGTRGEPLKQTEIGPVPKSWEIVRLDQVATIERGKFAHRPRNAPQFYGGNIPFVQTGDVSKCDGRIGYYTQTLNERGLAISRMFPRGTILITIAANIGYTGILEFDSACTDSLVAITPTRGDSANFLNHYLQTQQPVMDRLAPQGTQKNINIQFLKPWPIPRPSTDEQAVISDALNQVDQKRRTHERLRDSLSSLFRTLLHQLMTAQVRVHELDLSCLMATPADGEAENSASEGEKRDPGVQLRKRAP
jgi:type I restriction enzyme, S subunit